MAIAAPPLSLADWRTEATRLFGPPALWRFCCPNCSTTFSVADLKFAGAKDGSAGQECIGRHLKGRGCLYAAYGLIALPGLVAVQLDAATILAFPFAAPGQQD
jgi:hypothetical protein